MGQIIRTHLLLAVILLIPDLHAQNNVLRFDHLTVDNGLTQNTVQGIIKDKYGFMWFSTWEGLCRWDGYNFKVYVADPNNPKTISNNRVELLYKDLQGNIWINCVDTQICRYNYLSDDFTRFRHEMLPQALLDSLDRSKAVHFTSVAHDNHIWQINQSFNRMTIRLPFNKIKNLNQLVQIDKRTDQYTVYKTNIFNKWALTDETAFNVYLDDNEILWVGTYSGGVNKADTRQKPFSYYFQNPLDRNNSIIDNKIRAFAIDNDGDLWVGTHNMGITKINRKTNTFTHFQHNPKDTVNSILENEVRKIYNDRFGNIWIGSKGGLDRYNPKTGKFKHYTSPTYLPHNWVYEITEDLKGDLWIGTWNGFIKYNRKKDSFIRFNNAKYLKSQKVRAIIFDKNNDLWIGTEGGGVTYLKRKPGNLTDNFIASQLIHLPEDTNTLISNRVFTIVQDEKENLWIGTDCGLDRYDPVKKTFTHFGKKTGLPDELITALLCDLKSNVWISHKKGLTRMNTVTFKMRTFSGSDGLQAREFSENACYFDRKSGEMFFGGVKGFNSFYPEKLKDNPYLPRVYITDLKVSLHSVKINEMVNGSVILTKPVYLTNEVILNYKDKTISFEFSGLHYSNPSDNKYAYQLEGFDKEWTYTDASKREASYSDLKPGTYYFKVKASNNDGIWNNNPTVMKVTIQTPWWKAWWFRIIIVLFIIAVVYFLNYFLEINHERKERILKKLVHQRTQELEASNSLLLERQARIEEQSEELRTHSENLRTANELLTQKQALIKEQAEQLQQRNQELLILNSTKDRFFSIIAHDLRNPFHVVSGFSEILLRDFRNLPADKIEKFVNLIYTTSKNGSYLLENLLQWSRSQTGRIPFDPAPQKFIEIAKETIDFFEGAIQKKNLQVELAVQPDLTVMADEHMLKTIVRNLISNAVKFTKEHGKITISNKIKNPSVEITIADTGVGIPKDKIDKLFRIDTNISTSGTSNETGTGLGLILCKEFVEKHNGKIRVESEEGKGSSFIFTIPLI